MRKFLHSILLILISSYLLGEVQEIEFEEIAHGFDADFENGEDSDSSIIFVTNWKEWENAWNKIHGRKDNAPTRPKVDFGYTYVLVAIDKVRGSGGYDTKFENVLVDTESKYFPMSVEVIQKYPIRSLRTMEITRPYHVIKYYKIEPDFARKLDERLSEKN